MNWNKTERNRSTEPKASTGWENSANENSVNDLPLRLCRQFAGGENTRKRYFSSSLWKRHANASIRWLIPEAETNKFAVGAVWSGPFRPTPTEFFGCFTRIRFTVPFWGAVLFRWRFSQAVFRSLFDRLFSPNYFKWTILLIKLKTNIAHIHHRNIHVALNDTHTTPSH